MADLGNRSHLLPPATEGQFQVSLVAMYDFVAQLVVGAASEALTIDSGVVTPTSTLLVIDTEGATSTDDLTNIAATNVGAKTIFVRTASSARDVTLKHNSTGSGKILLAGGADLTLDDSSCMIALRYDVATTTWTEQWRNFGIHAPTAASKAFARSAIGLGTASIVDTGTASNQVPLNSNLGQLATMNVSDISNLAGATGDFIPSLATSRTGCVLADGRSIGSATSGATNRANADTQPLYNLIWSLNSANFPLRNGGVVQSRGASASADWAAGYTLDLPDLRGRALIGRDNMGGTAANRITTALSGVNGTIIGAAGGLEAVVLTEGQLAAHFHATAGMTTSTAGSHRHTNRAKTPGGGVNERTLASSNSADTVSNITDTNGLMGLAGDHSHTIEGQMGSVGSNEAHTNLQPSFVGNIFIRL